MTVTIDLPESVEKLIQQVAAHRKVGTETVVREAVLEQFPLPSRESGLHHLDEVLAELDALPAIPSQVDYSRINTASCYEAE